MEQPAIIALPHEGYKAKVQRRLIRFCKEVWRDRLLYVLLAPFILSFTIFIFIPVIMATLMSFTSFDAFSFPRFIGFRNLITLFTQDFIFLKHAIPNTMVFAFIVGPGGYVLSFIFAWLIYQLPKKIRDYYALALYTPSMAGGVALSVVWVSAFSGDRVGYINNMLLKLGILETPVLWLQDPKYLMGVMILVTLWTSFSVGFLAMLAGLQTVNTELYEAGRIDGIKNSLQEVYYITIPSMKPQMLFSAIMTIVGTIQAGAISVQLTGQMITSQYAGHLINNHLDDYAFIRYELGYASAIVIVTLFISYLVMRFAYRLFGTKEGE